jgi:hypothetical protein
MGRGEGTPYKKRPQKGALEHVLFDERLILPL